MTIFTLLLIHLRCDPNQMIFSDIKNLQW